MIRYCDPTIVNLELIKNAYNDWLNNLKALPFDKYQMSFTYVTNKNSVQFLQWMKEQLYGNGISDQNGSRVKCEITTITEYENINVFSGYIVG